jgi:hypothetical protein
MFVLLVVNSGMFTANSEMIMPRRITCNLSHIRQKSSFGVLLRSLPDKELVPCNACYTPPEQSRYGPPRGRYSFVFSWHVSGWYACSVFYMVADDLRVN